MNKKKEKKKVQVSFHFLKIFWVPLKKECRNVLELRLAWID
jgi:hypothetical protein